MSHQINTRFLTTTTIIKAPNKKTAVPTIDWWSNNKAIISLISHFICKLPAMIGRTELKSPKLLPWKCFYVLFDTIQRLESSTGDFLYPFHFLVHFCFTIMVPWAAVKENHSSRWSKVMNKLKFCPHYGARWEDEGQGDTKVSRSPHDCLHRISWPSILQQLRSFNVVERHRHHQTLTSHELQSKWCKKKRLSWRLTVYWLTSLSIN